MAETDARVLPDRQSCLLHSEAGEPGRAWRGRQSRYEPGFSDLPGHSGLLWLGFRECRHRQNGCGDEILDSPGHGDANESRGRVELAPVSFSRPGVHRTGPVGVHQPEFGHAALIGHQGDPGPTRAHGSRFHAPRRRRSLRSSGQPPRRSPRESGWGEWCLLARRTRGTIRATFTFR